MPADHTLSQEPSAKHGDGNAPYPCAGQPSPPGPRDAKEWAIDYGYCRTSLDHQPPHYKQGSSDPRCPRDCPHKAPSFVVVRFASIFAKSGAKKAAEFSVKHKARNAA